MSMGSFYPLRLTLNIIDSFSFTFALLSDRKFLKYVPEFIYVPVAKPLLTSPMIFARPYSIQRHPSLILSKSLSNFL